MLPGKPANHRLTALNTAYLAMGIIGLLYFVFGFWILRQPAPVARNIVPAAAQNHHYLLLFISLLELGMGIYIFQAEKKTFLFFQSLATMFILTAHGLIIYQFHTEHTTGNLATDLVSWAAYLLVPAVLLHLLARLEHRFKRIRITAE
ncbi:MAG: hypothetical protein JNM68_15695 [Dinghuibacter sp.]|nr:hypothetical protein [Dinghuibacter sp.]